MTQEQAILLSFKVAEVAAVASIIVFIGCYTRWAPWHRNAIGRTIVIKDALLILAFIPSILSLFWHFNRLTSHIAAWIDVAVISLIAPVMAWRTVVFWKIHRNGASPGDEDEGRQP